MHDVLVHYLEVNFPEIAEQLAHARAREPSAEERAAAAERLRELIRRLRRGAAESGTAWHEPRASAAEMIAGVDGELSTDERAVLDHFFELFARSMERTQAATRPEPAVAEPVAEPAVAVSPATEVPAPVETQAEQPPTSVEPVVAAAPPPEAPPEPAIVAPPPEAPPEPAIVAPPPEAPPEPAIVAPPPETPSEPPVATAAPPEAAAELPVTTAAPPEPPAEPAVAESAPPEPSAELPVTTAAPPEPPAEPAVTESAPPEPSAEPTVAAQVPPEAETEAAAAAPPLEAAAPEPTVQEEPEPAAEPAAPGAPTQAAPAPAEVPAARLVPEQMASPLQTILLAAAQQALDLLQVDATQVYTLGEQRRFVLRAGVPTESLAAPEGAAAINSGLLQQALEHNEVFNVEDLATEELTPDEAAWVDAGYRGFAAIALSPPLERPIGVLALLRRSPWRLDRRDAVRLEDLAVEVVAALRVNSLAIKVAEVAVLQERLNLAREIHDGLASDLAAVVALFKYYEQRRQRDPDDASQLLPQLRSMTEEILAGARNILQSLRPKTIRSEGLLASVLKLVDQFGRVNLVETNVSIRGEENTIAAEQKEVIFQVLRESLSNVRKHSRARNLWVVLDLSSAPWVMTVRDDGRGFDVRRVAEDPRKVGSYGLVGMRERAELIGGMLEIVSQSLEGTVVTLIGPSDRSE